MEYASQRVVSPTANDKAVAIDVPQEVTDIIVDLLSHDAKSLKSCTLISRQWRDRSQYHLHRALKLDRKSDIPFLDGIYSDFLLASYVRDVTIETMWHPFWSLLLPVLQKLRAVRSLTLVSVGSINFEMHQLMAQRFASLESLSMSFVTFDNFSGFTNFLNAFSCLRHLALKNVYWSRVVGGEGELPVARIHGLRDLRFAYCTEQSMFVKWLMSARENLRLDTLSLTWYEKSDSVRDFLRFVGEHLRHLTFSYVFSDAFSRDWRERPLDLNLNTGLQTLEFQASVMLPYVWGSLPTIPEMLQSVRSAHLSQLTLHLANLDEEPVPVACLSKIDEILEGAQFSLVSTVRLVTDVNASPENGREQCMERIRASIHSAMSKLSERGMLHIGPSET